MLFLKFDFCITRVLSIPVDGYGVGSMGEDTEKRMLVGCKMGCVDVDYLFDFVCFRCTM